MQRVRFFRRTLFFMRVPSGLSGVAEGDGKNSNSTDTACRVPTVSVTMSCLPFCFLFFAYRM